MSSRGGVGWCPSDRRSAEAPAENRGGIVEIVQVRAGIVSALLGLALVSGPAFAKTWPGEQSRQRESQFGIAMPKTTVSLAAGQSSSFFIDLPSNISSLTARTTGTGGDIDLFVKQGVPHVGTSFAALVAESAGSSTGNDSNEVVTLQRGGSPGLTPGRWWIRLVNFGSTTATVQLSATTSIAGNPFAASIQQSGTWYEPAKDLQGFFVQYLSSAQAIVVWFTYTPDGRQAWLIGVGDVVGDTIRVKEFSQTRGARFGDAFNTNDVIYDDVGELLITFDSCRTGYASFFSERAAWPHEQLRIEQLTGIAGLGCVGNKAGNHIGSGMSGSWYDPSRSGEGWLVQVLNENLAVAYWFTYDAQGNQAWVGGVGQMVDGTMILTDVIQPVGGRFGAGYSPNQVTLQPWGAMAMTFSSCERSVMQSFGPTGYGAYGSDGWARLTSIAGLPSCDLRATPANLTVGLQVAPFSSIDGDVNDPATPNIDNDTPAQTQAIGNPQIVAGYLAATPTGKSGDRFETTSDITDAYRLTLTAGQTIQLLISDWSAANPGAVDFDVYLYRAGNSSAPVQTALGTGRNEFLTVAETGQYDIVLQAFAGRGNYTLAITSTPAPASAMSLTLEDDAVEDQLIVRFDEPWDDGSAPALYKSVQQRVVDIGLPLVTGQPGRPQLFELPPHDRSAALSKLGVDTSAGIGNGWGLSHEQQATTDLVLAIKALRSRPDVRYVERNTRAYALSEPSDPRYRQQWSMPMINAAQAWGVTLGLPEIVVAVADTGVNPHPDLAASVRTDLGVDLITSPIVAGDGNGRDLDARDPGDGALPTADTFHGTHVAGIVAAIQGNGRGITGVAPGARIMPVRVLGRGGGSFMDINDGILWAAGETVSGARSPRKADILNLSLGGSAACPQATREAVDRARAAGVIVIAAAGNENSGEPTAPADCPGVVKVAAVGRDLLPSNYSNCNQVDVAAPGGEVADDADQALNNWPAPLCKGSLGSVSNGAQDGILSLSSSRTNFSFERYESENGTSQAAPQVAGVAALMKSVYPQLTPAEFDGMLASRRLTFDPRNIGVAVPPAIANQFEYHYGAGIIDAFAAVAAARERAGGAAPNSALVAQPSAINFGDVVTTLILDISKAGSGSLGVRSIGSNVPWLTGTGGGQDGLGRYTLSVNRSGLPSADYIGAIRIEATNGTVTTVPVGMRVGPRETAGKAGRIYALLIDAITLQVVKEIDASAASGTAALSYTSIYPGLYYLLYGTDNDNDFIICDEGEFCGSVPEGVSAPPINIRGVNLNVPFAPLYPDVSGIGSNSSNNQKRIPAAVVAKRDPDKP
jgi:serine protease